MTSEDVVIEAISADVAIEETSEDVVEVISEEEISEVEETSEAEVATEKIFVDEVVIAENSEVEAATTETDHSTTMAKEAGVEEAVEASINTIEMIKITEVVMDLIGTTVRTEVASDTTETTKITEVATDSIGMTGKTEMTTIMKNPGPISA